MGIGISGTDIGSIIGQELSAATANATYARLDGTNQPFTGKQTIQLITEQLRIAYNSSNYLGCTVASNGATNFQINGGRWNFQFQKGALDVGPTFAIINTDSTSKAMALISGTSGSGFHFSTDNSGIFAIAGDTKANFINGQIGQGPIFFRMDNVGKIGIGTGGGSGGFTATYLFDMYSDVNVASGPTSRIYIPSSGKQGYYAVSSFLGADHAYLGGSGASADGLVGSRVNLIFASGYTNRMKLNTTGDLEVYNKIVGNGGTIGLSIAVGGDVTSGGSIIMADAKNILLNTTTGTKIGTATTQKLGFWNATPIVQPASVNQVAVAATVATTAATNIAPFGYTTQAQADDLITEVGQLKVLINQIRTDLVSAGLIKGAA